MKLYNKNTDKIEDIDFIYDKEGSHQVTKISEARRNELGHFNVAYGKKPNPRYYTTTRDKKVIGNVYTISYTAVEKDLAEVQKLMIKDLKEASDKYIEEAMIDTELGFRVRAKRSNLDDFERGAKRGKLKARDIYGREHTVTKTEMLQIASDIEANGEILYDTFWAKFDAIMGNEGRDITAFQTVDECIYYEATPYEVEIDMILVPGYKNNVKDWN